MRKALLVIAALALWAPGVAQASSSIRYGVQDDAWLASGPGTVSDRVDRLQRLGVQIVRYTVRWDQVARRSPARPSSPADPAYDWAIPDSVLNALHEAGIDAVVTLYGTPKWANGGRGPNFAPRSPSMVAAFARATAVHYPWVRRWLIWNEPNQRIWLRPTSATVYTRTLLNPAYSALHGVRRNVLVGGAVTAPRGNVGGVSPVDWLRQLAAAHARLDAYASNPYPLNPRSETPWSGGCTRCRTFTMANLPTLLADVQRYFPGKRVWLTEYGYQTNPPDRFLGVSLALQARYLADAALRAYLAPRVDMLINFLVRDEPNVGRWQSGLLNIGGVAKPSYYAFSLPLAEVSRHGSTTVLWGQVRPGSGRRTYVLEQLVLGRWKIVGGVARTDSRGFLRRTVRAPAGARFRLVSPPLELTSPALSVT
ncbi:MAG TPA: hypothetical protein VF101_07915 [Gaiellaceae bacterium]